MIQAGSMADEPKAWARTDRHMEQCSTLMRVQWFGLHDCAFGSQRPGLAHQVT
jgi:hypothetical protein